MRVREPRATVVLTEYHRPENMSTLLAALALQSEPVKIIYINNSGRLVPYSNLPVNGAFYVAMPSNGGCFPRLLMSVYATTPYVIWWADDFIPTTGLAVERLVTSAAQNPNVITGLQGHGLNKVEPYYDKADNATGNVPIIKGNILAFRRSLLSNVSLDYMGDDPEYRLRCDDLHLSLELGEGLPVHIADEELERHFLEIGPPVGLCNETGHYAIRNAFCREWLQHGWGGENAD